MNLYCIYIYLRSVGALLVSTSKRETVQVTASSIKVNQKLGTCQQGFGIEVTTPDLTLFQITAWKGDPLRTKKYLPVGLRRPSGNAECSWSRICPGGRSKRAPRASRSNSPICLASSDRASQATNLVHCLELGSKLGVGPGPRSGPGPKLGSRGVSASPPKSLSHPCRKASEA